jgi:hypothetical protein
VRAATSFSLESDTKAAARRALAKLTDELGGPPHWLLAQASAPHDLEALRRELSSLAPGAALHGGTSCLGAMTQAGFHSEGGLGLGLFGIRDDGGSFGVGAARAGSDPAAATGEATRRAIASAGRPGEVPSLIWLSAAPGAEEAVVAGIEAVVGHEVPIVGGSTADNAVEGKWKQITREAVYDDAIVVSALFPSSRVVSAFQSGYSPTEKTGTVTRAVGRKILAIDGRPAARVYDEWTGGAIAEALPHGGNILGRTTLFPLGRQVGAALGVPYYRLAHPETVTPDGGLTVFADVCEGDSLVLMTGTADGLLTRAGRVAEEALERARLRPDEIAGALVIFCAGCMLTVKDRMRDVILGLNASLRGQPFLGCFTFGEQGCFVGGENRHGNLMISVTVFSKQ